MSHYPGFCQSGDCRKDGDYTFTPIATTTVLTRSADHVASGVSVTFTATVAPASGSTPTGNVKFYKDAVLQGAGFLVAGVATFAMSFAAGTYAIVAVYDAQDNWSASTSNTLTEHVYDVLVVDAGHQVANGAATVTVTLTLRDTSGNPITGAAVTFIPAGSGNICVGDGTVTDPAIANSIAGAGAVGATTSGSGVASVTWACVDYTAAMVTIANAPLLVPNPTLLYANNYPDLGYNLLRGGGTKLMGVWYNGAMLPIFVSVEWSSAYCNRFACDTQVSPATLPRGQICTASFYSKGPNFEPIPGFQLGYSIPGLIGATIISTLTDINGIVRVTFTSPNPGTFTVTGRVISGIQIGDFNTTPTVTFT